MERWNVGILIFDGVEVLDFAGPFEVFSRTRLVPGLESRRTDDSAPFRVFTVAPERREVVATGGLRLSASFTYEDAPPVDLVKVPGINHLLVPATTGEVDEYATLKARLGFFGAALSTTASILRYPFPTIEVEADGKKHDAKGALVCNISELAGPYRLIPDGRFDDGRMELFLFKGKGLFDAASLSLDLFRAVHMKRRDVEIHHVERVVFTGPPDAFVQLDGDALRGVPHPIEMTLLPKRLYALVA
jgi:hypothetical protein